MRPRPRRVCIYRCVCVCVNADDHSRVKLERSSLDYINASLVVAADAGRSYILTQVRHAPSRTCLLRLSPLYYILLSLPV